MVVLRIILFILLTSAASGEAQSKEARIDANETKVCRSQGGRFPPYVIQGGEPKRVRGAETLSLCKAYKWKTCCGKEQTDSGALRVD